MRIDPRGIRREIVSIVELSDGTHCEMECGHVGVNAPHFAAPKVGTERFCYECGQAEERL